MPNVLTIITQVGILTVVVTGTAALGLRLTLARIVDSEVWLVEQPCCRRRTRVSGLEVEPADAVPTGRGDRGGGTGVMRANLDALPSAPTLVRPTRQD